MEEQSMDIEPIMKTWRPIVGLCRATVVLPGLIVAHGMEIRLWTVLGDAEIRSGGMVD